MKPPVYANYPRYAPFGRNGVPPGPKTIRFAVIGEAWELIRYDFNLYSVAVLLYAVIGGGVSMILSILSTPLSFAFNNSPEGSPRWFAELIMVSTIPGLLANMVSFILGAGMFMICLKRLRGESPTVANLFDGFQAIVPLAVASLAVTLLKMLGLLFLIVPGLYALGIYAFVAMLIVDQKLSASDAMRVSADTLRPHWATMAAFSFVIYICSCIGIVACYIGLLFTGPIYFMGLAIHYHAFFPPAELTESNSPWQSAPTFSV